jgi:hypothetical protein
MHHTYIHTCITHTHTHACISCNDDSVGHFIDCIGTNYGGLPEIPCNFMDPRYPNGTKCAQDIGRMLGQPVLIPRVWSAPDENFENLASATLTILRLMAQDNMRPIFHALTDIPRSSDLVCPDGTDGAYGCAPGQSAFVVAQQPTPNNAPENALFPIVFIFIANAFLSQLVIGVLVDSIRRQSGSALYTESQRVWNATNTTLKKLTTNKKPVKPSNPARLFFYDLLASDGYQIFIMTIIILNTMWMATSHEPLEPDYKLVQQIMDYIFISIYVTETVLKLFSYGVISWYWDPEEAAPADPIPGMPALPAKEKSIFPKLPHFYSPYFGDAWNSFDFVVVALSLADLVVTVDLAVFKLLRVMRVFRLVRRYVHVFVCMHMYDVLALYMCMYVCMYV